MDLEEVKAALLAHHHDLTTEMGRLTAPPEAGATVGFGKRVGDGTTEAVERFATTATARSLAKSLADIDRALTKIKEGSYGVCDGCGIEIPAQRLTALPAASRCRDCSALPDTD
jgi:DnaK suppressor protein